jgi:hypothetical protein
VALASAWAAAARARARHRAETADEAAAVDSAGDRPDAVAAARQKAAAVAAAAKQVAGRAVDAAKDTPHIVSDAVTRLKDKAARPGTDRPSEDGTDADASPVQDSASEVAKPEPTAEQPRTDEGGKA